MPLGEAATSGRCLICTEPLDPANETLFKEYCHERCLPNCAQCGLSVEVHSCARIWREPDRKWKALHTSPCPKPMKLTGALRSRRLKEYLAEQAAVRTHARAVRAHARAEQERQQQIIRQAAKGGPNPLARGCLIVVAFIVALGVLIFLIKFFWELAP